MANVSAQLLKLLPGLSKQMPDKRVTVLHVQSIRKTFWSSCALLLPMLLLKVADVQPINATSTTIQKNDPKHTKVVIFSTVIKVGEACWKRVAIICCQCKSVPDTIERFDQFGLCLLTLLECYLSVDEEHCFLDKVGPSIDWGMEAHINSPGFSYVERPCHMEGSSYSSALIHLIMCMKSKFSLDYVEAMQLVVLHGYTPFTVYCLCTVLFSLLQKEALTSRGTAFREMVAHKMLLVVDEIQFDDNRSIPGFQYAKYRETNVATKESVDEIQSHLESELKKNNVMIKKEKEMELKKAVLDVNHLMEVVKQFTYHASMTTKYAKRPTNRESRKSIYRDLFRSLSGVIPCGNLGTNHLLQEMSVVGLLHAWLASEVWQDAYNLLGFKKLRAMHNLEMKDAEICNKLLDMLSFAIEEINSTHCSCQTAENIICKAFCFQQPSKPRYKDLYCLDQHYFFVTNNGVDIYSNKGLLVKPVMGALMDCWNWKGESLSLEEIGRALEEANRFFTFSHFVFPEEFNNVMWLG